MRRFILPAVAALTIAGVAPLYAQTAAPAPAPAQQERARPAPQMRDRDHARPGREGEHRMHQGMRHGGPMAGLFYRDVDRRLTNDDVQKIAEAMLVWHGQRDWRVTDVTEGADNTARFAYSTKEGGVIARFTIDRKTGRIQRVG